MSTSVEAFSKPEPRYSTILVPLLPYALVVAVMPYLFFSTQTLLVLRWHYVGGGSAVEKIHPGTYLLVLTLAASVVLYPEFRRLFVRRISTDLSIGLFFGAVIFTAAYTVSFGDASVAPFIDTFVAAILTTVVLTCIPTPPLIFLRRVVDLFFALNIVLIFAETALHTDFIAPYMAGVVRTPEEMAVLGGQMQGGFFGRLSALFGHPLNAAMLFGIYSIASLVSIPMRFSTAALFRLALSILSYLAIFPTESRSSMVVTTVILAFYLVCFSVGAIARGRISPFGLSFALCLTLGAVVFALILVGAGYFDKMLLRFQYDDGSALSRDYALNILQSITTSALWFGLSQSELNTLQQSFGLIAIEISWINFILVGGLITTVPLFVTFCLFLFRSLPRYCYSGIALVSLLILQSTFASNSIWSKTTIVTSSLIVGLAILRRIEPRQQRRAESRAAESYRYRAGRSRSIALHS
jgi:hypothetical protein